MSVRCDRDLKQYAARNNRLERQAVRLDGNGNEEMWDKFEEEMEANKELSKGLLARLKNLPNDPKRAAMTKTFKSEYQKFQRIVNKVHKRGGGMGESVGNVGVDSDHPSQEQLRLAEVKRDEELAKKQQKVQQLNQDVADLAHMFKDVAALVDQQQDTVDQIAINVEKTKANTQNAAQELHQADEYLNAARKRWLCIGIILAIILVVIGIVIWVAVGNNQKK
mmetsp:Transcript_19261/g.26749  ORF Transcript_19261/g.26749 Transcript_19261/m.26749 type:complete len:222 (-) Transcript_19261:192-857(-)